MIVRTIGGIKIQYFAHRVEGTLIGPQAGRVLIGLYKSLTESTVENNGQFLSKATDFRDLRKAVVQYYRCHDLFQSPETIFLQDRRRVEDIESLADNLKITRDEVNQLLDYSP